MSYEPIRVLLIEDNPGDARLIYEMLAEARDAQVEVECVDRLSPGLERLAGGGIDVLLLDLSLPDGQGLDVCIRAHTQAPSVPIVILTGLDDETIAAKTLQVGAQDYLVKGQVDSRLLLRSLRYAIGRQQAEEALKESEEKYRTLVDNALVGVYITNLKGDILYVNDTLVKMLGFDSAEEVIAGGAVVRYKNQSDRKVLIEKLTEKGKLNDFELEILTKRGEIKNVIVNAVLEGDTHSGMLIDITGRKQAEEALKESEEKYRGLINNVKLGIFRSTPGPTGRFLEVNPAMEKITGYSREELLQMNVSDLYVHPEEREAVLKAVALTIEKATRELHFRKKDGTEIVVLDTKAAVRYSGDEILYFDGILEDITERKQAQEQVQRSQLLASLGEMTAGIAHEVNNPLSSVLLYSELLLASDAASPLKKDLKVIHDEAKRAARIMTELLTYSRRVNSQTRRLNLHGILKKILDMRRNQERVHNIAVATNLLDSRLYVKGDSAQLTQVFMNLMLNAEEALKESNGGNIVITTQIEGEWAKVSIADDGTGIPEENLNRVFHPFFTTKPVGEGTGLGLSICYGIVTSHGGLIHAENNEMGGATFTVALPLAESRKQGSSPPKRKRAGSANM